MSIPEQLEISYYKTVTVLNEDHRVFLVQHCETGQIAVKKELSVYNADVFRKLKSAPVPGIPAILALSEDRGVLTVIEEYISGRTLENLMEDHTLRKKDVLPYLKAVCLTLHALHSRKPAIIHRDIKPSNILISSSNQPYIIDLNAATEYTPGKKSDTILIGTEGYAAPEQYGFAASGPRTDIYALGVLMKELSEEVSLSSGHLKRIVKKCTEMNPNDRYASAIEVYDALSGLLPESGKMSASSISWLKFLPPGFRSLKIWHMLTAIPAYAFIIVTTAAVSYDHGRPIDIFMTKLCFLLMSLAVVFLSCNYLNVQRILPLCKSRKRGLRILGVLLFDFISMAAIFMLTTVFLTFI